MLGSEFKRGVATTLERVFHASKWKFDQLRIQWCGSGAAIQFQQYGNCVSATFVFPNVDDNAAMPTKALPKFIGMVLHELGHAWFTDNNPWDKHRDNPTLCRLINGLEDPRIERKVIESGIAANAAPLFENLINDMMGGTYVDPNDFDNLAFQLAVEGRRMNGYRVNVAPVLAKSRYRVPMQWALDEAHKAGSTVRTVEIAIELLRRLNALKPPPGEEPPCEDGEKDGPPGSPNPGEGGNEGEGEGPGDGPGKGTGKGAGEGEERDEEAGKQGNGKGQGGGAVRPIEPDLAAELKAHACKADEYTPRPACRAPTFYKFDWS